MPAEVKVTRLAVVFGNLSCSTCWLSGYDYLGDFIATWSMGCDLIIISAMYAIHQHQRIRTSCQVHTHNGWFSSAGSACLFTRTRQQAICFILLLPSFSCHFQRHSTSFPLLIGQTKVCTAGWLDPFYDDVVANHALSVAGLIHRFDILDLQDHWPAWRSSSIVRRLP